MNALFSPLDALLDRYCGYLLYWYTSANTDAALFLPLDPLLDSVEDASRRVCVYLLYWYNSTNTDTALFDALLDSVEDASRRVVSFGRAVRRYSVYLLY